MNRLPLFLALLLVLLPPAALAQTPPEAPQPNFFARWADFYKQDWHPDPNAPPTPAPPRRGLPSPLDAPPFPGADWSYGGSPVIGEPDTNSYPLMTAINGAKGRTKIYGWLDPPVHGSPPDSRNAPEGNYLYSNRFELNQAVLYIERLPDSVQQSHIDWGFHLTALYGTDYRYTTNKGYFSNQLLVHNYQYGFDPALEYVDIYFPHVAKGMNVRMGRYISIPGIEAQLSPNNYFFSHSLLYVIDPFTDTGILSTIKLSDRWLVQFGITASHDVAVWTPDAKTLRHRLRQLHHPLRQRQHLRLPQRHQRRHLRLQQRPAVRHHLVPQIAPSPSTWPPNPGTCTRPRSPASTGPSPPNPAPTPPGASPPKSAAYRPRVRPVVNYLNKATLTPRLHRPPLQRLPRRQKVGQRTGYQNRCYTENTISWNH